MKNILAEKSHFGQYTTSVSFTHVGSHIYMGKDPLLHIELSSMQQRSNKETLCAIYKHSSSYKIRSISYGGFQSK